MMERIAKFYKVSKAQFVSSYVSEFGCDEDKASQIYENIKLPKRATTGSAGYDFFSTVNVKLNVGESIKIPTGIRAEINDGWVLQIFPRSG